MKARRIVFRILIIVLIGVVLGSVVYTRNAKRVMHDEFPMPLGFEVSVVLTGSMEPTLSRLAGKYTSPLRPVLRNAP